MQQYDNQTQCAFCGSQSVYDEYLDLEDDFGIQVFHCSNCRARCEFDTTPDSVEEAFKRFMVRFIDEEVSDGESAGETEEADGSGKTETWKQGGEDIAGWQPDGL